MQTKNKSRQSNPKIIRVSLVLLFVFMAELLFYTWCRVQCTHLGYEISEQAAKIRQLNELQANLKVEQARLRSPQRIAKIARNQLGLITPTLNQTIVIKP